MYHHSRGSNFSARINVCCKQGALTFIDETIVRKSTLEPTSVGGPIIWDPGLRIC